jgi:mono/diheme cytochrome c family protein
MKIAVIIAAIVGFTATAAFRSSSGLQQPASKTASAASASGSIWDGVYTEAQQKRGAAIYARECSTCHGETLKGGEGAPPLSGSDFSSGWNDQTVADLFDKIRLTMPAPPEQPGKLTPQQDADVVAHILSVNAFPAGPAELSTDLEQLKRIRITFNKP